VIPPKVEIYPTGRQPDRLSIPLDSRIVRRLIALKIMRE